MKKFSLFFVFCFLFLDAFSQDMSPLITKLKAKLDAVNDYVADGKMKTDIAFIKAPLSKIKVYYKKPNYFKLKKDGGISILPKGGVTVNMASVLTMQNYLALSAGNSVFNGVNTKIVKLLPSDENSDIVLTTLYVDEKDLLVLKAITTTKDNGTYQMDLTYGKYANYGLPDKVIFNFDAKDYKMPKGVTLEFDQNAKPSDLDKLKGRKGKIEITYNSYIINQGLASTVFK
ncbi:MAG: LolA family protein [Chitinophagaceae bacterium]